MGYVMAGLMSGLGAGISKVGDTLEERRKTALEWAAKLDLTQRQQEADATIAAYKERKADARFTTEESGRNLRSAAEITAHGQQQAAGFQHDQTMEQMRQSGAVKLTQLRGQIENQQINLRGANDKEIARLQAQLNDGDVTGVQYGSVDEHGMAEALLMTKSGLKPSGVRVLVPESRDGKRAPTDAGGWVPSASRSSGGGGSNPFAPATTGGGGKIAAPSGINYERVARAALGSGASPQQIASKIEELKHRYGAQ